MDTLDRKINLHLRVADAIVLAEFIRELERKLEAVDPTGSLVSLADRRALDHLDSALESQLTEPLIKDYRKTFESAVDALSSAPSEEATPTRF